MTWIQPSWVSLQFYMFIFSSQEKESSNLIEAIGEKVDLRPPTVDVDVDAEKGTSRFIVQDLERKND